MCWLAGIRVGQGSSFPAFVFRPSTHFPCMFCVPLILCHTALQLARCVPGYPCVLPDCFKGVDNARAAVCRRKSGSPGPMQSGGIIRNGQSLSNCVIPICMPAVQPTFPCRSPQDRPKGPITGKRFFTLVSPFDLTFILVHRSSWGQGQPIRLTYFAIDCRPNATPKLQYTSTSQFFHLLAELGGYMPVGTPMPDLNECAHLGLPHLLELLRKRVASPTHTHLHTRPLEKQERNCFTG